ncbi:MAG TPA: CDP-alcohol phosphatidyltransferase family protein [Thermoanaerobaculia bacterium]|nr:CDP-alcohol phosphatidyltransferase family protein [Thermoanaerobaculia bacterium]
MSLTIPNFLSILRMGLVPFFIISVIDGEPRRALLIFVAAGVTDALDGAIARLYGQQSLLGAYLDPIADKLLLTSAYVTLSIPGLHHGTPIPVWVTVLVLARDILIVIMALVLYLAQGVKRFPPSVLSKLTTVVQVTAVGIVLLSGLVKDLEPVVIAVAYLVAGMTVASGVDYILRSNQLVGDKDRAA